MDHSTSRPQLSAAFSLSWAAGLLVLYLSFLLHSAWVGDDAFITLRTVDNILSGYGPRWNVAERVQSYTNPLWMFVLTFSNALIGEPLLATHLTAISVSLITLGLLLMMVYRRVTESAAALLLILSSAAFIDYSTSGLENPLTHLLVLLFLWVFALRGCSSPFLLGGLTALAVLNRMDTALLYLPALVGLGLSALRRDGVRGAVSFVSRGVVGALPLLLWMGFSLFYYGFPFPNTAYAKLGTGMPREELLARGVTYFLDVAHYDTATLFVIVSAALAVLVRLFKNGRDQYVQRIALMQSGVLLYVLYILVIGGDFMAGRFFSAPFLVSVTSLVLLVPRSALLLGVMLMVGALVRGEVQHLRSDQCGLQRVQFREGGIIDERCVYFFNSNPWQIGWGVPTTHPWAQEGRQAAQDGQAVVPRHVIGFFGYYAGPKVHVVDRFALADPLLARLPAIQREKWRPGHFDRFLPHGYLESLESGEDRFEDRELAARYQLLETVVRAPLLSRERLAALWQLHRTGFATPLLDARYRGSAPLPVSFARLNEPLPTGTAHDDPRAVPMLSGGIEIAFAPLRGMTALDLSVDGNDRYQVRLFREQTLVARIPVRPTQIEGVPGLRRMRVTLPAFIAALPIDRIQLLPRRGDGTYVVGHLIPHVLQEDS